MEGNVFVITVKKKAVRIRRPFLCYINYIVALYDFADDAGNGNRIAFHKQLTWCGQLAA